MGCQEEFQGYLMIVYEVLVDVEVVYLLIFESDSVLCFDGNQILDVIDVLSLFCFNFVVCIELDDWCSENIVENYLILVYGCGIGELGELFI